MKLYEILGQLLESVEKLEDNEVVTKQWIKSIREIDKSTLTGYSLVGDFISEDEELKPELYLVFQEIERSFLIEDSFVKWEGVSGERRIVQDADGNIVFERLKVEKTEVARRGILFDFSGTQAELLYYSFLPQRWAKRLWTPITNWLEAQPNIETKIKFWEEEVILRADSLRQAQQRLDALKRQIATTDEGLDPQTKEWLQTAAILGTKKGSSTAEAALKKTIY